MRERDPDLNISTNGRIDGGRSAPRWPLLASVCALLRAWSNRRQVRRLLEMDDSGLKDLGLRREDVLLALSVRMSEDPSARLVAWRDERWFAARAQVREVRLAMRARLNAECHSDNEGIDSHDEDMTK